MQLNVNKLRRKHTVQILIAGLMIAGVSFACAFSPRDTSSPFFYASGQAAAPAVTPVVPTSIVDRGAIGGVESVTESMATEDTPAEGAAEHGANESDPILTPTPPLVNNTPFLYYTQAGDTLPVVAVRYGVQPNEITSPNTIPPESLLNPGQLLIIPNRLANVTSSQHLIPDSEVVYSPSAIDFDVNQYVNEADGYLKNYTQYLATTGVTTGADVVSRIAIENSINPKLLLALLDYQSGWVRGSPSNLQQTDYPMGRVELREKGLYQQLAWGVNQLSIGYYGWREGRMTEITFSDGVTARLAPDLNAGTAALQYYFAQLYDSQGWLQALDPETGFPMFYEQMFGSPWVRALSVEPLYPPDLTQLPLILPFLEDQIWGFTGGPHGAWEHDGAWAAIDFAPGSTESGCVDTDVYTVAAAPGLVVRSGNGVVSLDLDGDGREQTGWVLIYLHIADKNRVPAGTWLETGGLIGHPSCKGGFSTGTHLHLARKYNGEWIVADGPLPFVLSGWRVNAGSLPYEGSLTRGNVTIPANPLSPFTSQIIRRSTDP